MDLYLAGVKTVWGYIKGQGEEQALQKYIDGINMLESFYYADEWTEQVIPRVKNFLLDSGAFTFFSNGKAVDWEDYIKRYAAFIIRNKVDHFFELDIDPLVGYQKVLYYRAMLEDLVGKPCIPVWHKSRGLREYEKICEDYSYIAIGGIVTKEITRKDYKHLPRLLNDAHKAGARVHGLGFTSLSYLPEYHFDSVDSTSWTAGNRFGHIYKFDGKTMRQIKRAEGQRIAVAKHALINNYVEWIKFSQYADTHL